MLGSTIGPYEILARAGQGAMGDVYRAVDTRTGAEVAVKALKPELVSAHPETLERFKREGEALRELDHPNVVKLLDVVQQDGTYYLVMEYIPCGDLASLIAAAPGGLPLDRALSIALDVADALTRAHRLDILHRDLKPANILLTGDGSPRLTDFGLAHLGGEETLTQQGTIIGTVAYLSPEACMGLPSDARADIWSFGVILYEMLADERPFAGDSVAAILNAILSAPPPDLQERRLDVPDSLNDLIYRMLEKSRDARISSVRLVGAELEAILKGAEGAPSPGGGATSRLAEADSIFATPTPEPAARRHNLPAQTTPFVGRKAELAELARLLGDPAARLVTILGPGGMGKSRLAIETAGANLGRFPDGCYFVELAPLGDPESIPSAIADATGYQFRADEGQQAQVINFLRNKSLLLMMDNFEHLVIGAELVTDILQAAPAVKVLATSRQRLNLSGETVFTIGGMDFPDWETPEDAMAYSAVQLFMQSARRARVDFELQPDDLHYVARICRLVQGMPLGILLAAAWVDTLSPGEIADEIGRSVDFLESQMQDLPDRHRSMRTAFEYSWKLLDGAEQDAFARMAVFRGGCSREAAQQVTGASIRMLTTLVSKSLLQRSAQSARFTVHELLRQLAGEQLAASGQAEAMQAAHSQYYLAYLADREADLRGRRQLPALDEIDADFENIRAAWLHAVEQGDADAVDQALEALDLTTSFRSRFGEGAELFHKARARWPLADGPDACLAGRLLTRYPDPDPGQEAAFRHALQAARQHCAQADVAYALNQLGRYLSHQLFDVEGFPLMEEALAIYQALGNNFAAARVLDDIAFGYGYIDVRRRIAYAEESLAIRRHIGDRVGEASVLLNLGVAYWWAGLHEEGRKIAIEALEVARQMRDWRNVAWHSLLMVELLVLTGHPDESRPYLEEVRRISQELGDPDLAIEVKLNSATLMAITEDRYDEALALALEAYPPDGELSMHTPAVVLVYGIAAAGLGRTDELAKRLRQAYGFLETIQGITGEYAWYAPLAAAFLFQSDEIELAAEVIGAFEDEAVAHWARGWPLMVRLRADLESRLGPESLQAALERGKTLDLKALLLRFDSPDP